MLGSLIERRSARRTGPGGPPVAVWAAALLAVAVGLVPVGYVVVIAAASGPEVLAGVIVQPRTRELVANTVLVLAIAVPTAIAVGVFAAWAVERSALRARRVWAGLLAAPLVVPAFVITYGWVSAVPGFTGLPAAVAIATLAYYPLVYLPVAAGLRRVDPALEEVAASLGRAPAAVFWSVVLPQLRLPILGGALLVGLHLLAEYGAFAMLRFDTFTTAIVERYRTSFAGPATAALAIILVGACVTVVAGEAALRGRRRHARVGSGVSRPRVSRRGPGRAVLTSIGLALLIGLAIGVPAVSIVRWLGYGGTAAWADPRLAIAAGQSLLFGLAGAALAVGMALPIALLGTRHPSRVTRTLEGASYLSGSLPGIVIALAFATVTIRLVPPLYQTPGVLVVAYALLFLPRALVSVRTGFAQAPIRLDEVSRSLGKSPFTTFRLVTARLLAPAAAAGGALVFLGIVNELTATLLLGPLGTRTLATGFWSHVVDLDYASAAPYAVLMIALSVPMVWAVAHADVRS